MSDYVFFLLLGAAAGAIIAGFGLGLLITHQGSGVVNFAFGAMATWAGYLYADVRHDPAVVEAYLGASQKRVRDE